LLPRLCSVVLSAPRATRQLLVKWWSDYPPELLLKRVVTPLQAFLTRELMATKKLTVGVMNAIKVLAKVEEANQLARAKLPPEGFYNALISEKMDVQDHYSAWRQTQDAMGVGGGAAGGAKRAGADGPFSFCSYAFLLDPRAKSNLLHIEARFQMEQTVAHARMEQQLYGAAHTRGPREDDVRVVMGKEARRALMATAARPSRPSAPSAALQAVRRASDAGDEGVGGFFGRRTPRQSDAGRPAALARLAARLAGLVRRVVDAVAPAVADAPKASAACS